MDSFQARIKHDDKWWAAIVLPIQKFVIFADYGTVLSLDDCEDIVPYKTWSDLTKQIIGDDNIKSEE